MVYTCVVCVFLFVGSFAIGPGAIPWFITAEMFTQASRGAAMTVCVAVNWICQILIAQIYPTMLVSKIAIMLDFFDDFRAFVNVKQIRLFGGF